MNSSSYSCPIGLTLRFFSIFLHLAIHANNTDITTKIVWTTWDHGSLPSLLSLCWPLNSGLVMSIWSVSSCKTPGVFQLWNRFFLLIRCTHLVWNSQWFFGVKNSSNLLEKNPNEVPALQTSRACPGNWSLGKKPIKVVVVQSHFSNVIKVNIMHIYCDFHSYIKSIIRYQNYIILQNLNIDTHQLLPTKAPRHPPRDLLPWKNPQPRWREWKYHGTTWSIQYINLDEGRFYSDFVFKVLKQKLFRPVFNSQNC